ncbi:SGNH/GDSL hydrolase family protein [Bifidobacterium cebidarum]|uniref:GDSL-like Lipase/Acylhydrolase family n=1 Tax=Bifidobacterium cebidarum TaxID=2650773 RepID=A0A6I1GCV7_9BIFI|nr:SGNH/GDSL hydrolase family protein [Bifidobacterium cebidarum]KAB7789464.1 GDSL-like Lipase/Acylhydrolase family [Bifidobacterium cebidarum]
MKQTVKHKIKYPEGTDLVRNASAQFEAMAQSIDDNIDDLPDTITAKVTAAQQAAENAAAQSEKFGGQAQALQDSAVSSLIGDSKSATVASLATYTGKDRIHAVFFGDSITANFKLDDSERGWASLVCAELGLERHNYAVRGAGFAVDGKLLSAQLATAKTDLTYDHAKVSLVCVAAGINDQEENAGMIRSAATQLFESLAAEYPNARILCGIMPTAGVINAYGSMATGVYTNSNVLRQLQMAAAADPRVETIPMWRMWGLPAAVSDTADNIHPGYGGHRIMASQFLAAWHGSPQPDLYLAYLQDKNDTQMLEDGIAHVTSGTISLYPLSKYISRINGHNLSEPESVDVADRLSFHWASDHLLRLHINQMPVTVAIPLDDKTIDSSMAKESLAAFYLPRLHNRWWNGLTQSVRGLSAIDMVNTGVVGWSDEYRVGLASPATLTMPERGYQRSVQCEVQENGWIQIRIAINPGGVYLIPGNTHEFQLDGYIDIEMKK